MTVQWDDRAGTAREVAFATFIARNDPVFAGALALGGGAAARAVRGRSDRAPSIPLEAKNLGDGRSVWKPVAGGNVALIVDNGSGDIVSHCTGIGSAVASSASRCLAQMATSTPSFASSRAMALPTPLLAPVMTATFPVNSRSILYTPLEKATDI